MQEQINQTVSEYYFNLPDELIARYPVEPYDYCKLMVLDVASKTISHSRFDNLCDFLEKDDLLIVNDTKVEKRRVFLKREDQKNNPGARIESIFLERFEEKNSSGNFFAWKVLIKKRQRLKNGEKLYCELDPQMYFIVHKSDNQRFFLEESVPMTKEQFLKVGQMPIPPYLKREEEEIDEEAYQNPFSVNGASVAAPTASLHFTKSLLEKISQKGINVMSVTLDIGYGTFAPLKLENFKTGKLHKEYYSVPDDVARTLADKKFNNVYAVGTTALRVIENVFIKTNGIFDSSLNGETELFLYPPYEIKSVDGMITNFHLPGSSLLMLVSCLTGKDFILSAYKIAIEEKYRFFSYGDAMLIRR
jgi:S-adenosylmethionine:tRNA ribosyltransferase-isomerase